MDIPDEDGACKCTEVASPNRQYALNMPASEGSHLPCLAPLEVPLTVISICKSKTDFHEEHSSGSEGTEVPYAQVVSSSEKSVSGSRQCEGSYKATQLTCTGVAVNIGLLLLLVNLLPAGVSSYETPRIYGETTLFEGGHSLLYCDGHGVKWFRDRFEPIGDGAEFEVRGSGGSMLMLKNVSAKHDGNYFCKEIVGVVTKIDRVTVKVLAGMPDVMIYGRTPVMVGGDIHLLCRSVTAKTLTILHNGELVKQGNGNLYLVVPNVSMDDGGVYVCIQDNDHDKRDQVQIQIIPANSGTPAPSDAPSDDRTIIFGVVIFVVLILLNVAFLISPFFKHPVPRVFLHV